MELGGGLGERCSRDLGRKNRTVLRRQLKPEPDQEHSLAVEKKNEREQAQQTGPWRENETTLRKKSAGADPAGQIPRWENWARAEEENELGLLSTDARGSPSVEDLTARSALQPKTKTENTSTWKQKISRRARAGKELVTAGGRNSVPNQNERIKSEAGRSLSRN
jgi:hypothetical protein